MVTRNEADRYLRASATWLRHVTDLVVAYDDQSTDDTYEILADLGVAVGRRPSTIHSFAEHEGRFRQAAWTYLEARAKPTTNDWILSIDADEFLVGTSHDIDVRDQLTDVVEQASSRGISALNFHFGEVFDLHSAGDGTMTPFVRVDGLWGQIRGCRLVRWRAGGRIEAKEEACGSLPQTWMDWQHDAPGLQILHLGYAREADRREKFERYRAGRGHDLAHVRSILTTPMLQPWVGPPIPVPL